MSVILVEDSRVFASVIAFARDFSDADAQAAARTLAELSPLCAGVDMLSACARKGGTILAYAALPDSVFGGISREELDRARLVMPASALLAAADFDGVVALVYGGGVCVAKFENGGFANAGACAVEDGDIPAAVRGAFELAELGGGEETPASVAVYKVESVGISRGTLAAELTRIGADGGVLERVSIAKKARHFASAELRNSEMLKSAKKSRFVRAFCVGAVGAYALCAFSLAALGAYLLCENARLERVSAELSKLEPAAARVEAMAAEAAKLADLAGMAARPVETLAALNALRPDGVVFEKLAREGGGAISVSGRADSIVDVKKFTDALNDSEKYSAKMSGDTVRGKTRFTVSIVAKGGGK